MCPSVRHKRTIGGEARETLYWLRLLAASNTIYESRLLEIMRECDEIVAVLTATIKRLSKCS